MQKLVSDTLWKQLRQLGARSTKKVAAVAYVTSDALLKFGREDVLIVDASDQAVKCGETSAPVLKRAVKRGAALYSCPGLHAKVYVFDNRAAVIGSSNVSQSSSSALIEAAVITDQVGVVAMARLFVDRLARESTRITPSFLERISTLPVSPRRRSGRRRMRPTLLGPAPPRTWIINVTELDDERFPEEASAAATGMEAAEKRKTKKRNEVSWIRWAGRSRFRALAREGDSVIQIWKTHRAQKPQSVYPHAPVLLRQEEPTCTRFYIEDSGDGTEMAWPAFQRLTKRIELPGAVGPFSSRAITDDQSDALRALWIQK
jgi:hypothetical protein